MATLDGTDQPSRTGRRPLLLVLVVAGVFVIIGAVVLVQSPHRGESPSTVVATVPVGHGPKGLAVDPSTRSVYIADSSDDTVSVIQSR